MMKHSENLLINKSKILMRLQIGIDPIVLSAEVSLSMQCVPPGYCTVIIGLFSAVAAATYKRQETAICFFPDHTFFSLT